MQKEFKIYGMHCASCEKLITKEVTKIKGVKEFKVSYNSGKATINATPKAYARVLRKIKSLGYSVKDNIMNDSYGLTISVNVNSLKQFSLIAALVIVVIGGLWLMQNSVGFSIPAEASYALLFITGLMVGFHCIGMCGGFLMSCSTKGRTKAVLTYGIGKLISYTVIGGLFGFIGSLIEFTPLIRGIAGVVAGLFLMTYGLSNLGFGFLKRIRIPMPARLNRFIAKKSDKNKPFITGLLNGLMIACGPLQAMYIYAAGTGNMIQGALSLLFFGLGTLPVMLSFGFLTSYISSKATHKIIRASGALMIVLGLLMLNYGLALTGTGLDFNTLTQNLDSNQQGIQLDNGYQIIRMNVTASGWNPNKFVLKAGVPVKWIINGKEITSCNNAIQVPKLGLQFNIKQGEQVIEFTPNESGVIPWSCWMGMIPGVFIVKDDNLSNDNLLNSVSLPKSSGCSCGG